MSSRRPFRMSWKCSCCCCPQRCSTSTDVSTQQLPWFRQLSWILRISLCNMVVHDHEGGYRGDGNCAARTRIAVALGFLFCLVMTFTFPEWLPAPASKRTIVDEMRSIEVTLNCLGIGSSVVLVFTWKIMRHKLADTLNQVHQIWIR